MMKFLGGEMSGAILAFLQDKLEQDLRGSICNRVNAVAPGARFSFDVCKSGAKFRNKGGHRLVCAAQPAGDDAKLLPMTVDSLSHVPDL